MIPGMHFPPPKKVNAKNIQFPSRISVISKRDVCIQHQPIKTLKNHQIHSESPRKSMQKRSQRVLSHTFKYHSNIIQISSKPLGKNIRYHQIISNPLKNLSKVNQKPIKNPSKIPRKKSQQPGS